MRVFYETQPASEHTARLDRICQRCYDGCIHLEPADAGQLYALLYKLLGSIEPEA